jgi:hypothetical protein
MVFIFALPIVAVAALLVLLYKPEEPFFIRVRTIALAVLLLFMLLGMAAFIFPGFRYW